MSEEQAEPRRVLVAEDEGLIRLDIVETLTQAGFEVVGEAADGEEAVELALELEPDLCVMDVKMPKMDGITAAEKILQELSCAVVMLTAFSQTELVERARDAGAMAYVVKPFSPSDLIPAVEIALSRHAEIESLENQRADLAGTIEAPLLADYEAVRTSTGGPRAACPSLSAARRPGASTMDKRPGTNRARPSRTDYHEGSS